MGSKISHMIGSGASPQLAKSTVGGNFDTSPFTAAGTTRATGTLLTAFSNYVGTVSASGKGVQLPQMDSGDQCDVYNGGAHTLYVYTNANTSDTITNGSANQAFVVGVNKGAQFRKVSSSLVMVNLSA